MGDQIWKNYMGCG